MTEQDDNLLLFYERGFLLMKVILQVRPEVTMTKVKVTVFNNWIKCVLKLKWYLFCCHSSVFGLFYGLVMILAWSTLADYLSSSVFQKSVWTANIYAHKINFRADAKITNVDRYLVHKFDFCELPNYISKICLEISSSCL